jgi:endonuclease YncB( thermonuclease family)
VHGVLPDGSHRCLRAGQFCTREWESTYRKHGFSCRPGSDGRNRLRAARDGLRKAVVMRVLLVLVISILVATVTGSTVAANGQTGTGSAGVVAQIIDGDTISLTNGKRVRLLQIDATELGSGECYSRQAARILRRMIPEGSTIRLEADARLDQVDRYGRLLRYVWSGRTNVNLELVRQGAATVWFYDRERGKYATQLLTAAREARAAKRGIWGACNVVWDAYGAATALARGNEPPSTESGEAGGGACHPGYRPCLPVVSDLDCRDIADSIKPIRVLGDDPYRLDGDGDGRGCEA